MAAKREEVAASSRKREFASRMDNWRRVVNSQTGSASSCCAAWAKWYVALRVSEGPPAKDVLDEKVKPLRGVVTADHLDGWMIEAAWRMLGDYNDRMALKAKYVFQFPDDRIRLQLKGVRGPHVKLVVARAEKRLQDLLITLESADTILS
ncbi:hypothetical protein ASD15_07465 [Massilia sp. Root351]|jgi:hypothetical protein|uniref:hypothetical protein n=1 Tax=Massilia sp. Root351 TaxID=1736522 RepID=UPI000708A2EB|nr:hypothetical protein [Massilia sp. Root351]KQV84966.1 hypothetical protein ASD15_07465 [Massilia sp. Root351]